MSTFSTTTARISLTLAVLVTAFLSFDFIIHLARESHVVAANEKFGAPDWFPVLCGAVLGTLVVCYWIPASRAMATVLITAYLGGAVATNLITEQPLFNTFCAIVTAVLVWAGAWARDARLRALVKR
jgi:hypothetical protein